MKEKVSKRQANQEPIPTRGTILLAAKDLTCGERNLQYGEPSINLACAQALIEIYREYCPRGNYPPAHDQAIFQICTKLGRIATRPDGASPSLNHYTDLAAYAAIAGEIAHD